MSKKKSYIVLSIIIVVGIVLDLITKIIFAHTLGDMSKLVIIPGLLVFTYVKNTGAAFGMLGNNTLLLTIISVVFIIGFVIYDKFNHSNNPWYIWGMGMVVSGAIGNFIDRIFLGYVRDFISFSFFSFVCNIADILITFGIICLAIYFIIDAIKDSKNKKETKDDSKDK